MPEECCLGGHGKAAHSLGFGVWGLGLSGSRFIKEKCWMYNRFVREARIVEYGSHVLICLFDIGY